jgi:peroxiredoxin Q/BCP
MTTPDWVRLTIKKKEDEMIEAGSKAPAFSLVADDGKKVSLKDFAGRKVVLYFYPKDATPG